MKYFEIGTSCHEGMSDERYRDITKQISKSNGLMNFDETKGHYRENGRHYNVYVKVKLPKDRQINREERNLTDGLITLFEADHLRGIIFKQPELTGEAALNRQNPRREIQAV